MSQESRSARDTVTAAINHGVAPLAKAAGFKKSGLNFHRRRGSVVQVVNFQLSQWNFGDEGHFYVNVGLAFDEICQRDGRPVEERVKEWRCHFRSRLEQLVEDTPDRWEVDAHTDVDSMGTRLQDRFRALVEQLDGYSSLAGSLTHPNASVWARMFV